MSDPNQLESELRQYLEREPNLRRDERLAHLKAIFNKHLEHGKLGHVINRGDFLDIVNQSKVVYANLKLPFKISKKQIDSSDLHHVALIESVFSYLNKMNLLKKVVRFDDQE